MYTNLLFCLLTFGHYIELITTDLILVYRNPYDSFLVNKNVPRIIPNLHLQGGFKCTVLN